MFKKIFLALPVVLVLFFIFVTNCQALPSIKGNIEDAITRSESTGTVDRTNYVTNTPKVQAPGITSEQVYSIWQLVIGDPRFAGTNDVAKASDLGAMGSISNLMATTYTPPASSITYFADIAKNAGFYSPAYAQDSFASLGTGGILQIWKTFRNLAYLALSLVFVVIGIAIMFRLKINPQTAIGVQNAIPRLIIVLLLITFSYAIAGFVIDLMYVVNGLIVELIIPTINMNDPSKPGFFVFTNFFFNIGTGAAREISDLINPAGRIASIVPEGPAEAFARVFLTFTFSVMSGGLATGPAILLGTILSLIALFIFIRVFIMLIKAYVGVLLKVVFGPMQILLGAFPGSSNGFGSWLRGLISDLAVFPTVLAMIALAIKFQELLSSGGTLWNAPFIGSLAGGGETEKEALGGIVAFGFLLLTPKAAEMVKDALQVKPFAYGSAFGEGLSPATGPAGKIAGAGARYPGQAYFDHVGRQATAPSANMATKGMNSLGNVFRTMGFIK